MGVAQAVGLWGAILFPWLVGNLMGRFGPPIAVRVILLTAAAISLLYLSVRSRAGGSPTDTRRTPGGSAGMRLQKGPER